MRGRHTRIRHRVKLQRDVWGTLERGHHSTTYQLSPRGQKPEELKLKKDILDAVNETACWLDQKGQRLY